MAALLVVVAFFCEYIDSSLGMGYGTTLTPILLLLGYPPIVVVPTILFSEFLSGLTAGACHRRFGNISLRRGSRDRRIVLVLAGTGIVGTVLAVFTAVNIPKTVLTGHIGAMVLAMGLLVFLFRKVGIRFSWPRIIGLGVISAFNKGLSGGGYGPLVVSGQILSGHDTKNAIAATSIAEGLICAVGLSLYLAFNHGTGWFTENWRFFLPIVGGALASAPIAAWTTRWVSKRVDLRIIVAVVTCALGAYTLWKTFA
jgi:uncharacterized membrane protein YfcA